jgi:hypothetical protein
MFSNGVSRPSCQGWLLNSTAPGQLTSVALRGGLPRNTLLYVGEAAECDSGSPKYIWLVLSFRRSRERAVTDAPCKDELPLFRAQRQNGIQIKYMNKQENITQMKPRTALAGIAASFIMASTAQGADGLQASPYAGGVEHFVRIEQDGKTTDVGKVFWKGRFLDVAAGLDGKLVSAPAFRTAFTDKFKPYGKIHPTLAAKLAQGGKNLTVAIWFKMTDTTSAVERPVDSADITKTLAALTAKYDGLLRTFMVTKQGLVTRLGITEKELHKPFAKNLPASPFLLVNVTPERVKQLAASTQVAMLFSYDPKALTDLDDCMEIAGADLVQATGLTGKDVKVAVWESSPDDTSELSITAKFSTEEGFSPSVSDHARLVTGIIKNKSDGNKGFAPGSKMHSADDGDLDALDWAIDKKKVSAVNQSFHRFDEQLDIVSFDDIYKDYKLLHYPWTLIVHAAGNWVASNSPGDSVVEEWVNHKCYNHINVGNHNDAATTMSGSSCFINPTTTHEDRELPEICANGTQVSAVGLTKSGTSFSSPATVGSVALLQEKQSILKIWPEGVRALLLAGSLTNVPSHSGVDEDGNPAADAPNTWWKDVSAGRDGFDGAGALNIDRSVKIAGHRTGRTGASEVRGWDIGKYVNASFNTTTNFALKTYTVKVPAKASDKSMLRVALAWNSRATATNIGWFWPELIFASNLTMDLDIRVYEVGAAGALTQVGRSLSYDNSYEVADVPVKPGKTYVIKVHRWRGASSEWTWFGAAWDLR